MDEKSIANEDSFLMDECLSTTRARSVDSKFSLDFNSINLIKLKEIELDDEGDPIRSMQSCTQPMQTINRQVSGLMNMNTPTNKVNRKNKRNEHS